jgi:hypothetical protein
MKYKPSAFYSNFSIAGLVQKYTSRFELDSSGLGTGGSVGANGGSHSSPLKECRYHRSARFSCRLKSSLLDESDEAEFTASLKADVEDEIVRSGAHVTDGGDLKVHGFYFRYAAEGIQGRIELSGRVIGEDFYSLTAAITETSTIEEQPLSAWENKGRRPAGLYYVVPFMSGDPYASADDFLEIGRRAVKDSVERVRQKLLADPLRKEHLLQTLEYAEVYVLGRIPPEIKQRWASTMGEEFGPPAEYDQYEKVFFLNDIALSVYRDAGAELEILKTISADEVPGMAFSSLRGPYRAKEA